MALVKSLRVMALCAGVCASSGLFVQGASAQTLRPPVILQNDGADEVMPSQPDESGLLLRINKLENALRQMNGQIEQLQFQNRQLQDQMKKLGEGGVAKAAPADAPTIAAPVAVAPPAAGLKKSDAFEPSAQPNAPGVPRPLGIGPAPGLGIPKDQAGGTTGPLDISKAPVTTGGTVIANDGPMSAKQEYDLAAGFLRQGQYGDAETGFRNFLTKHPKDRLVADATFNLGETYLQRNRPREAAEQYLKVSSDFPNATRAPESMLRLGIALGSLNAHEQSCATFQEISRKYPNASTTVKRGAEREIARSKC